MATTADTEQSFLLDSHNQPIKFDGNRATLKAYVFKCLEYVREHKLFPMLLEHRAVATDSGDIIISDPTAVHFILGEYDDLLTDAEKEFNLTGTMTTPARLTRANERATLAARAAGDLTMKTGAAVAATKLPDGVRGFKVNPAAVDKKIAELAAKIALGLKENQMGRQLVLAAKGDGFRLLELMELEAAKATDVEESLVADEYDEFMRLGLVGELTIDSLAKHVYNFEEFMLCMTKDKQPQVKTQILMIKRIALKGLNETTRNLYNLATATTPPTSLDEAVEALKNKLQEADLLERLTQGPAPKESILRTEQKPVEKPLAESQVEAVLAMVRKDPSKFGYKPKEPKKHDKPDKHQGNRDKDGKIKKHMPGMRGCRHCGGNHLDRDCPNEAKQEVKIAIMSDEDRDDRETAALLEEMETAMVDDLLGPDCACNQAFVVARPAPHSPAGTRVAGTADTSSADTTGCPPTPRAPGLTLVVA